MLPSETELKERYASYSNNRLLSIVHYRNEYTPLAVEIAKAELASRNLSIQELDVFFDELEARQVAAKTLGAVPLNLWEKMLFFFLWFTPWFLGGALRMNYDEDGLALKVTQSRTFALAGFTSLILDGIISVYFNLGSMMSIGILLVFFIVFQWLEKRSFSTLPPAI